MQGDSDIKGENHEVDNRELLLLGTSRTLLEGPSEGETEQGELEQSKMAFLRTCVMVNLRWQLAGSQDTQILGKTRLDVTIKVLFRTCESVAFG